MPLSSRNSPSKAASPEMPLDQYGRVYRKHAEGAAVPGWAGGVHLESLGNLAHELRTPVQVVLGYLDILRDTGAASDGTRPSDPIDHEIIERMNAKVLELAQTVENLMDFAVAQAHAETANEEEIELAQFFAE